MILDGGPFDQNVEKLIFSQFAKTQVYVKQTLYNQTFC